MKKGAFLIILILAALAAGCALAAEDVMIGAANFPDSGFREYVKQFDTDRDGALGAAEIALITDIDVKQRSIGSLKGIEFFTALKTLDCSENAIKRLDVSGNTGLTSLVCFGNQLTKLKISGNPLLKKLSCGRNQLTKLDVSGNPELQWLLCGHNQLSELVTGNNPGLLYLYCDGNRLTGLDLSGNTALKSLGCSENSLRALDLSHNTGLTSIVCSDNKLRSLDLSKNVRLDALSCGRNRLTGLDLSGNPALTFLQCDGNRLTALTLSGNTALASLACGGNRLTKLDLSANAALEYLDCRGNRLTSLDLSGNSRLNSVNAQDNAIDLTAADGRIPYKSLPGFKIARASAVEGARKGRTAFIVTGSGTVTYTYDLGRGFTAAFTINVTCEKTEITSLTLPRTSYAYTGDAIEPEPAVKAKVNGKTVTLKKDTDYTVTWENNTERGTASVTVEGRGEYRGTLTGTFTIVRAKITSVTLSKTRIACTGKALEPEVTVKRRRRTLTQGTDYTVTYRNNVNAGEAAVTVKGRGNYTGTITKAFTVTPVKILKVTLSRYKLPYTGKARRPVPTVTARLDGQPVTLKKGIDYTVTYENNIEIGTATVTITGKGNYTGTLTKTFIIR